METEPLAKRICDELTERFPDAGSGPAHIVIEDYNLETFWVEKAIADLNDCWLRGGEWWGKHHPKDELEATREALLALNRIPEPERVGWYANGPEYVDMG